MVAHGLRALKKIFFLLQSRFKISAFGSEKGLYQNLRRAKVRTVGYRENTEKHFLAIVGKSRIGLRTRLLAPGDLLVWVEAEGGGGGDNWGENGAEQGISRDKNKWWFYPGLGDLTLGLFGVFGENVTGRMKVSEERSSQRRKIDRSDFGKGIVLLGGGSEYPQNICPTIKPGPGKDQPREATGRKGKTREVVLPNPVSSPTPSNVSS